VRALALLACLLLAACTCAECDEERLPFHGHADTPDHLVAIVQHEAKFECTSGMYDLLSEETKKEHSRTAWRLAATHITVPDYDYKVVDIAEKGTYLAFFANPADENEGFAYYDYQEPGKKKLKLRLLLLRQGSPPEWRIAMVDQDEKIRAGDGRYWWFDR